MQTPKKLPETEGRDFIFMTCEYLHSQQIFKKQIAY